MFEKNSLRRGDVFYVVHSAGIVERRVFVHSMCDQAIIDNHRCFHTEQQAKEFQVLSQSIAYQLDFKNVYDSDYVPNWKDDSVKYAVLYELQNGKFQGYSYHGVCTGVVFSSRAIADACADWLNEYFLEEWRNYIEKS